VLGLPLDRLVQGVMLAASWPWLTGSPDNLPNGLRATKLGVADDGAGQSQVPPGSASDAMPTLQDAHDSAEVHSSPWPRVR
jgi:hypothetical protein